MTSIRGRPLFLAGFPLLRDLLLDGRGLLTRPLQLRVVAPLVQTRSARAALDLTGRDWLAAFITGQTGTRGCRQYLHTHTCAHGSASSSTPHANVTVHGGGHAEYPQLRGVANHLHQRGETLVSEILVFLQAGHQHAPDLIARSAAFHPSPENSSRLDDISRAWTEAAVPRTTRPRMPCMIAASRNKLKAT